LRNELNEKNKEIHQLENDLKHFKELNDKLKEDKEKALKDLDKKMHELQDAMVFKDDNERLLD
jgi:L-lactate utilization protein LutB